MSDLKTFVFVTNGDGAGAELVIGDHQILRTHFINNMWSGNHDDIPDDLAREASIVADPQAAEWTDYGNYPRRLGFYYEDGGIEIIELTGNVAPALEEHHRTKLASMHDVLVSASAKGSTSAILDVIIERCRQTDVEGWTDEHDDRHANGQLAMAAACYARHASLESQAFRDQPKPAYSLDDFDDEGDEPEGWPWGHERWKPKTQRRDLVRAGALIIAEIDRLDRANERNPE